MVLESDLELAPAMIYKAYEDRWEIEIEIVMRYYKSACEFDEARGVGRLFRNRKRVLRLSCHGADIPAYQRL